MTCPALPSPGPNWPRQFGTDLADGRDHGGCTRPRPGGPPDLPLGARYFQKPYTHAEINRALDELGLAGAVPGPDQPPPRHDDNDPLAPGAPLALITDVRGKIYCASIGMRRGDTMDLQVRQCRLRRLG